MKSGVIIFLTCLAVTNGQWVVHNVSQTINTTWIAPPGYGGGMPVGPPRNMSQNPGLPPVANGYYPNRYNSNNANGYQINNQYLPNKINKSSHHLFVGTVGPYDSLLFKQQYQKTGKWFQAREKIIQYPVPGVPIGNWNYARNITAIRILDLYVNDLGGYASILSGGVGHRNVTIKLVSQSNRRGFNFKVEIYGQ